MNFQDFFINNVAYFIEDGYKLILMYNAVPIFIVAGVVLLALSLIALIVLNINPAFISAVFTILLMLSLFSWISAFYFHYQVLKTTNEAVVAQKKEILESETFTKTQKLLNEFLDSKLQELNKEGK
jgi:hypothetical protein